MADGWYDWAMPGYGEPANYNPFGIREGSKHYAADTMAALTRAQWQQTRGQLQPVVSQLKFDFFNPQGRQQMVQQAGQLSGVGLDQAQTQLTNTLRSSGQELAPDQAAAIGTSFDNARNVSLIDAKNRAGRAHDELRTTIATGV